MIIPNNHKTSSLSIEKDLTVDELKDAARPYLDRILTNLCGVPSEAVANPKRHFPCPKCGGKDRFRVTGPDVGRVFCNQCFNSGNGDILDTVRWAQNCDIKEACRLVAEEIGEDVPGWARGNERFNPPPRRTTPPKTPSNAGARTPEKTRFGSQAPANTPPEKKEYRYRDEKGVERWRVVRCDWPGCVDETTGKPKKTFQVGRVVDGKFEKGLNGEKVPPYNLPELINPACRYVCVVEGEKCAVALRRLFKQVGFDKSAVATTLPNGSNAARRWGEYVDYLRGKEKILVFADNDKPGRDAARTIAKILTDAGIGAKVVVFGSVERDGETYVFKRPGTEEPAPEKYDVADFVEDLYEQARGVDERKFVYGPAFDALTEEASPFVIDASFFARQEEKAPNAENARVDALDDENEETGKGDENDVTDAEEEKAAQEGLEAARRRAELNRRRKEAEEAPEVPDGLDLYPITDFAKDCARVRGVPEAAYLAAAFAVLGAAVGRRFLFDEPERGYKETTPNPCVFLVGESATSKSEVLKDVAEPLEKRQTLYNKEYAEKKRTECPVVCAHDATPEGAKKKMAINEREKALEGFLALFDEGAKHFVSYGAKSEAGSVSRFIEAVEGNARNTARSAEENETVLTEKSTLSVIGGFQPKALLTALEDNKSVSDQGYIHRFQWIFIPWNDDTQRETAPPDRDVRAAYLNTVAKIVGFERKKRLVFTGGAAKELRRVRSEMDDVTKTRRQAGAVMVGTYWRKAHKTLAQIAALVHIVRWATNESEADEDGGPLPEIGADSVRTAEKFVRLFCENFEAVLGVLGFEQKSVGANGFLDRLETKVLDRIRELQNADGGATKTTISRNFSAFNKKGGGGRLEDILKSLNRKGFIIKKGRFYRLSEEDGE